MNQGFTYDALGRKLTQAGPLGTVSSQWDVGGRRTRMTWPDGNYVAYTWDNDDEMVNVEENGATSGVGLLAVFSYDNLGDRTGVTRGDGVSTSYGYDALGRLTSLVHSGATNTQGSSRLLKKWASGGR